MADSSVEQSPIIVEKLSKYFGPVRAVDEISFRVEKSEIVGLLGGNGAGKTTTIAMLLGLLLPTSGSARIIGHCMARARYLALPCVNFSSPYVDLPGRLTVRQNLRVYAGLYNVGKPEERLAGLAHELKLEPLLNQSTKSLSAGQKSRLLLAKALINKPRVLLLDEPTASLDPDTADWVRSFLLQYQRETGASILLASHNMQEVERICDRVLMMASGKIVASGSPARLVERFGQRNMEEVFLAIARGTAGGLREAAE